MAFRPIRDIWANLRQLANNDVWSISDVGAPVNGTSGTGAGFAGRGSLYINLTTGVRSTNTGTKASPTWTALSAAVAQAAGIIAFGTISSGIGDLLVIPAPGVLPTDLVFVSWKTEPQNKGLIIADAGTDAIEVELSVPAVQPGMLQYIAIRANPPE